jgi:hypothetical protein
MIEEMDLGKRLGTTERKKSGSQKRVYGRMINCLII